MSQSFYGSICLTDLIEQAKKKHSAFAKGKNGKIYANVTVWYNDNLDKFGNIMSIQINSIQGSTDEKLYIGNCKLSKSSAPISDRDANDLNVDLDIQERPSGQAPNANNPDDSDLPF